uniref:Secreted protein n=1 Tax=Salix viminalis TaxID=40686 RepID=A0A6N2N1F5_SALVM
MKFMFHFLWPPLCLFLNLLLQLLQVFLCKWKSIRPIGCQVHPSFLGNGPATWANGYSCRNALNLEFPVQDLFPSITKWKG